MDDGQGLVTPGNGWLSANRIHNSMDPQRWEKIKDLFERALSLAPSDRNVFLAEACGGDSALRADIEGLLEHHRSTTFLDQGPSQLLGSLISRDGESVTFQIAEVIAGRFKIVRFIGRGGMGEVYRAPSSSAMSPSKFCRTSFRAIRSG